MVYDISDPGSSAFIKYINPIDEKTGDALDLAPEGLEFIPAEESPNGVPLLTVSNEVSGTVSVYQIDLLESDKGDDNEDEGDNGDGNNEDGTFTLQILHAADHEAGIPALDNADNFSAVLNALEEEDTDGDGVTDYENTVTLFSGDVYIPGPFFAASEETYGGQGRGDILIQNASGFDAIAFGNHEFDFGTSTFADLISADEEEDYPGTAFPYLSSNLDFETAFVFSEQISKSLP